MANYTGWHVLLVEDTSDTSDVLEQLFTHHDIRLTVVNDGQQCLDYLEQYELPTLVLMDLHLPEVDGWQALMSIRANPEMAHLPVVAITAYHSPEVAREAIGSGFDAYFAKPVSTPNFISELAEVIEA